MGEVGVNVLQNALQENKKEEGQEIINKPNPGGYPCDGEEVDRKSFSRATRPITSHLSRIVHCNLQRAMYL